MRNHSPLVSSGHITYLTAFRGLRQSLQAMHGGYFGRGNGLIRISPSSILISIIRYSSIDHSYRYSYHYSPHRDSIYTVYYPPSLILYDSPLSSAALLSQPGATPYYPLTLSSLFLLSHIIPSPTTQTPLFPSLAQPTPLMTKYLYTSAQVQPPKTPPNPQTLPIPMPTELIIAVSFAAAAHHTTSLAYHPLNQTSYPL